MLFIIFGIIAGCLLPIQTIINTRLRGVVGTPFAASLFSFSAGSVFLLVFAYFLINVDVELTVIASMHPWWIWLGGLLGVVFLTGNILLFPKLGAIETVIMPILGQLLMSIIIDQFGLFNARQQDLTLPKLLGILCIITGVLCVVVLGTLRSKLLSSATSQSPAKMVYRLLGLVTGACSATQIAINGYLGQLVHASILATLISFASGAFILLLIVLFQVKKVTLSRAAFRHSPCWIWFGGGMLGACFVFASVFIMPILGTGMTVILLLLGQITGGILIEGLGLFGVARQMISPMRYLGLLVMFIGIILIKVA